ncbi:hypothetical protein HY496_00500 [Candidatus Woesearchaeota archaeon]|nr:hypothetical protein [Candidatus Woesearchaeota archaeon]
MGSSPLEKHKETLSTIYQSIPFPLFNLNDLEKIVVSYGTVLDDAVERKALHPYLSIAHDVVGKLLFFRKGLVELHRHDPEELPFRYYGLEFDDYLFPIPVVQGEIHETLERLYPLISQTTERLDTLSEIESAAEREIRSRILPNDIVGHDYLAEARFFIPTLQPEQSIAVYTVRIQMHDEQQEIELLPTFQSCYETLDLALRKERDRKRLETVVVVGGTEPYDLQDTVLPIVLHRYLSELCREE